MKPVPGYATALVFTAACAWLLLAASCIRGSGGSAPLGTGGSSSGPTGAGGAVTAVDAASLDARAPATTDDARPAIDATAGDARAATTTDTGEDRAPDAVSMRDGGPGPRDAATAPYSPCPPAPALCKIMPSGDSITVGAQSTDTGGYRVPLFQLALQNHKDITFVGPSGAGPATVDGVPFPDAHDGHSGYIIDTVDTRKGLTPLMVQNLTTFTPHIVLLMIGTNDVNSQIDLPNAPARLAALIDIITTTAPDTLLLVAQLIPTRTDSLNVDVQAFNAALPAIVDQRVKAGKHILLVDMYNPFTADPNYKTDLLFDGLHPNDTGYALMARTWYAAVSKYLN